MLFCVFFGRPESFLISGAVVFLAENLQVNPFSADMPAGWSPSADPMRRKRILHGARLFSDSDEPKRNEESAAHRVLQQTEVSLCCPAADPRFLQVVFRTMGDSFV